MSSTKDPSTSVVYREFPVKMLKVERTAISSSDPKEFVTSHLAHYSSSSEAERQYDMRVARKNILLVNPHKQSRLTSIRREKAKQRTENKASRKLKVIGRKEAKMSGIWRLASEDCRWEKFIALHRLWLGYVSELLGLPPCPMNPNDDSHLPVFTIPNLPSAHAKLVKADFHGSIMTVKKSKNTCLEGCSGIVIHETEGTFKVITKQDKMKVIPKRGCVFLYRIPAFDYRSLPSGLRLIDAALPSMTKIPLIEFDLYGDQFCFRSGDRSSKKFKPKATIALQASG